MALNGSIVITTRVDSGQATKDLESLIGRVQKLEDAQNDAAKAAANQAEQTSKLASASNAAGIAMGVFGAAMAAAAIGSIKLAADLEQSRVAFTTLLGSGEKARKFLDELAAFAASTPFEFKDLQDSSRRLLAFGFAAKDIIPIMNAVGSAVAGLGGGKEQIDRVTLALGQMQAKGKVSAEEMNQIAELGIPGWQMIAKAIGKSIPEAMKLAEKGAIDSTTAINALITGMNAKFPGMLEKQSQTINGQLSNLRDGVTLTATLIGERLVSAFHIADAVGAAARAVSGFAQIVKTGGLKEAIDAAFPPGLQATVVAIAGALTATLVPGLASTAVAFGTAVAAAAPFLAIGAAIAASAYLIVRNWEPISDFFSGLFKGIAEMAGTLRNIVADAFGKLVTSVRNAIKSVIDFIRPKIEALYNALPAPLRTGLDRLMTWAKGTSEEIGQSVQENLIVAGFNTLMTFDKIGAKVKGVTGGILSGLKSAASQFVPDIKKLVSGVTSVVADTAFTGLHGKPPATAAPTAAGAAAAKAAATKAEKEERERVKAHAKAISKIITLPDTATPKEGGRFKAQTEDLELARKKATAANNDFLASQVEVDIINRKVTATEANLGKATTERAQAQAELSRLQNLTTVMTPADEKEYKKRVSELTKFVKERDKEVADYRIDLNDLLFEREVNIHERTANALRSAYNLAFRLISGDFQSIFNDVTAMLGNYVVNALANNPAVIAAVDKLSADIIKGFEAIGNSPAVKNAISSFGENFIGVAGIAAVFGGMLISSVIAAGEEAKKVVNDVKAGAEAADRLLNPKKYEGENPRYRQLNDAVKTAEAQATAAEDAVVNFAKSPAFFIDALTGGKQAKELRDALFIARNTLAGLTAELGKTPQFLPKPAQPGDLGYVGATTVDKPGEQTIGGTVYVPDGKGGWIPKSQVAGTTESKPAAMPGETPDRPIYTQVVNVRDFRDAFPDSAYFRAPSVDTTRSLNANAVAYR